MNFIKRGHASVNTGGRNESLVGKWKYYYICCFTENNVCLAVFWVWSDKKWTYHQQIMFYQIRLGVRCCSFINGPYFQLVCALCLVILIWNDWAGWTEKWIVNQWYKIFLEVANSIGEVFVAFVSKSNSEKRNAILSIVAFIVQSLTVSISIYQWNSSFLPLPYDNR